MNKNMRALSLILLFSVVSQNVLADTKILVLSAQDIFVSTDQGKQASEEVEGLNSKYQKELLKKQQGIEQEKQAIQAKSATMSKDSLNRELLALKNKEEDLQSEVKKKSQEVQLLAQTKMEEMGKSVQKSVEAVGKQKGADIIIDETGRPLYVAEHLNITKDVALAMNTEYKTTQVATAKKDATPKKTA